MVVAANTTGDANDVLCQWRRCSTGELHWQRLVVVAPPTSAMVRRPTTALVGVTEERRIAVPDMVATSLHGGTAIAAAFVQRRRIQCVRNRQSCSVVAAVAVVVR